jgi:gamma-glutamyltranspeptidase/glutathione hydrolase
MALMRRFALFVSFVFVVAAAFAQQRPDTIAPAQAVIAKHGMVVAQEKRAAQIGVDVLRRGGNAVDATVAVGFAMAVTYPRAGNIGGGGFMLIHLAKTNIDTAIDYRETAPAAATPTMFLNAQGEPDIEKSRDSALSIGVPGTVAGLALAHAKYGSGKFTLADLIAPAIPLARDGVLVEDDTADSLPRAHDRFARWPSSRRIFLKNGETLAPGDRLVQTDLATTLAAIAERGPQGFYEGTVAQKLSDAIRGVGGLVTTEDLAGYRPIERTPVRGTYRGYDILSMPPSSSGGVHLVEMLNILEGYDLGALARAQALHLEIEAMKRAYADRAYYMGDPAIVKMPLGGLMSKKYAATLRAQIGDDATPAADIRVGKPADFEGDNTTHFSVVDSDGNAVSNTYTLKFSYGLGLVADGTGILLNNELDDFTAKPGAANAYGLVGYDPNLPGPNKRPLSSMTPTIVLKDGRLVLVTGSPGGSRIISTVLQAVVNAIDFKMPLDQAVTAPRLHHQWQPDAVFVEPGFAPEILEALARRGHIITLTKPGTATNAIAVTADGYVGVADTRTRGALAAGF